MQVVFFPPPTNHAPTITSTEITTATVGVVYTYDVDATDPDGDTLTYSLATKPLDMTIDSITGVINWTPDTTGEYDVTIDVEDGTLNDIQSFIIKVSKSSPVSPPATPPDDIEEIEYKVVASAQIDLYEGGVVEVTDETSEVYGTSLVIDSKNKDSFDKHRGKSEISILINAQVLGTNYLGDYQGWVVTPVGVTATEDVLGSIMGSLNLAYNEDKLSNSGVAKNTIPNVYRVLCVYDPKYKMPIPIPGFAWEKVPEEKITYETDRVKIKIGIRDLLYLFALTVTNCEPPTNLGTPFPGDLIYRLSDVGANDNWIPGHVGIYVGERYHKDDGLYNVIEELGSPLGMIGLGPDKVIRTYYKDITKFGGDQYVYMGAREPKIQKLNHNERNALIAFLENQVGKGYAFFNTIIGLYFGLARGEMVKGPNKYNCVGLTEVAYEWVNINIVNDEDEGNSSDTKPPDAILTPQEQMHRTDPASGIIDQNIPPVISKLKSTPWDSVETTKMFTISCYATDQDQDSLTYIWTIPGLSEPLIKGKDIIWTSPDISTEFTIYCKVKDNYGGEDEKSVKVSNLPDTYVITASAGSNGSIDPSGEITVNKGDDQSFTITSNENYQIADVLVDGSSVGAVSSYTFNNVTENHTISATFIEEIINHAPVINSTPITTATQDETYNYDVNAVDSDEDDLTYSLTTKPSGMIINSSTGLITWTPSSTGEYDVTVKASDGDLFDTQEYAITVSTVIPDTFTITASAGSNGSINPSGDVIVNEGSDQLFTISPDSGYQIDDVLVDGSSVGAENSYTFTNVTQDHTISASFNLIASNGPVHNLTKDTYYDTLQAALTEADVGDSIEVSGGNYDFGSLNVSGIEIILNPGNYLFGNLVLESGAKFLITSDTSLEGFKGANIIADNINIGNDCIISANETGYLPMDGPGAGESNIYCDSWRRGAAGYGGKGGSTGYIGTYGIVLINANGGDSYGNLSEPIDLGSGGQYYKGGGAIKIEVSGTLKNEGIISANGKGPLAGSSGGSIWIQANNLTGMGNISTNGGSGSWDDLVEIFHGSGAGGRISIEYNTSDFPIENLFCKGGEIINNIPEKCKEKALGENGTIVINGTQIQ